MNERIQDLLKQATRELNPDDRVWVFSKVDQAKFAELIVQECMNVLHDNELWNHHISHVLKAHFGVEE